MTNLGRTWGSVVVLCVIVGGVLGYVVAKRTQPVYQASIILAVGDETSPSNLVLHDVQASDSLAAMYGALIRSEPVLANVTQRLDLKMSWLSLKDHVHVDLGQNVPIVRVTVLAGSASQATEIANAIAARAVGMGPGAAKSQTVEQARAFAATQAVALQDAITRANKELSRLNPGMHPWERKKLRSTMQLITDWQRNYITFAHFLSSSEGSANNLRTLGIATASRARIRPHMRTDAALGAGVGALVGLVLAQGATLTKRRRMKDRSDAPPATQRERFADHSPSLRSQGNVASPDPWMPEVAGDRFLGEPSIREAAI
jgi:Chain length determinant protein